MIPNGVALHLHRADYDDYTEVELDFETAYRLANAILQQAHFGRGVDHGIRMGAKKMYDQFADEAAEVF
jgi:hypothetical protein